MRKKLYLIVPLLLLIAFAVYYHGYRVEADALTRQRDAAIAEINAKEARDRDVYQKKVAKEAREAALVKAKEAADKAATIKAEETEYEALSKEQVAVEDAKNNAAMKADDLTAQLREETDLTRRANDRISILADEKKFLDTYIPLYTANRDHLSAFLTKVEETKKAVEAAQAAAAATRR